ncbi:VOC family protein [Sphingomonas beigongshangi]|uniref:VOC family protein n=1 Tax=Sphingomonas beigongshangi TaxID=2782540 RepID=UPI00193AFAB6|nr:VOC family protein [Sphingomonas beigongshangi]
MATIRPFLPSKDFARSQAFYEAIGFKRVYADETVAILDYEGAGFLLQNYYQEDWAGNSMHQLFVDDLDAWWRRTDGLAERFGIREPMAPEVKPWGMRVGMLVDPAGVLWHVCEAESPAGRDGPR